jgi:hypothetical protein
MAVTTMRRLLDQMIRRPLDAFVSCVEMFFEQVGAEQMFDAAVSRFVHIISRPSSSGLEREKGAAASGITNDPEGKHRE